MVIGAGEVAYRKVKDLIAAGAIVTVIAPHIGKDLSALANDHSVTIIQRLSRKVTVKVLHLFFLPPTTQRITSRFFMKHLN